MNNKNGTDGGKPLDPNRVKRLAWYSALLGFLSSALLILLMAFASYLPIQSDQSDTSGLEQSISLSSAEPQRRIEIVATTLLTMLVAGAAGGSLCNLRGLFTHISEDEKGSFPRELEVPYYIRPLIGALTGLFTFFLGGLMVSSLSLGVSEQSTSGLSWATLLGRLPFIALAVLAGFAAQEFMQKLKETATTLFSQESRDSNEKNPRNEG